MSVSESSSLISLRYDDGPHKGKANGSSSEGSSIINVLLEKTAPMCSSIHSKKKKLFHNERRHEAIPEILSKQDQSISAQKQLIFDLIEKACFEMEIVERIPEILDNNGQLLGEWFDQEDTEHIYDSLIHFRRLNNYNFHTTVTGYRVNANVSIAFRMLSHCYQLANYIRKNPRQTSPFIRSMIKNMRELIGLILRNQSAKEEAQMKSIYKNILKLRNDRNTLIKTFKGIIKEVDDQYSPFISKIKTGIETLKINMEISKANHLEALNKINDSSQTLLGHIEQKRIFTNQTLEVDVKNSKEDLTKLRENNLANEKEKRYKCFKLKIKLEQWIGRYDFVKAQFEQNVRTFQEEISDLRQKQIYLNNAVLDHTETFIAFKQEKQERDKIILDKVRRTIAATIIQNWWRNITFGFTNLFLKAKKRRLSRMY